MAQYIKPKLFWMLSQNRYINSKVNVVPRTNKPAAGNSDKVDKESEELGKIRYNVCRDRATTCQKYVFDRKNVQKRLAGLQDEYDILPPAETSQSVTAPSPPGTNQSSGYRAFAASTTYKNVTLPLKSSKLANPFPEPVKLMPSHTVSDQEKADQMQADFRVPKAGRKIKM